MERLRERLARGIFHGMIATAIVSVIPIGAQALGLWPAPGPISTAFVERMFGVPADTGAAYIMAALGLLAYGGLWGAFLAYVATPATALHGLGVGLFRWFVTQWMVLPYLGWGEFGFFTGTALTVATLVTNLAFGAVAGYLLHREEEGIPLLRWNRVPATAGPRRAGSDGTTPPLPSARWRMPRGMRRWR